MGTITHELQRPSYSLSLVDDRGNVQYQSSAIEALLGYKGRPAIIHRDDMVRL